MSEEAEQVAAGVLDRDEAHAARLWPPRFTAEVDEVLLAHEREVAALDEPSDEAVWAVVERAVLALDDVDAEHGRIETEEREDLCGRLDAVLTRAGVDVDVEGDRLRAGARQGTNTARISSIDFDLCEWWEVPLPAPHFVLDVRYREVGEQEHWLLRLRPATAPQNDAELS